jgi:membrane-bound serine protease (ClpP class)
MKINLVIAVLPVAFALATSRKKRNGLRTPSACLTGEKKLQTTQRSVVSTVLLALVLGAMTSFVVGISSLFAPVAGATVAPSETPTPAPVGSKANDKYFVNVIDVGGYIDRVTRDFILESVENAVTDKAQALIIQLNSPGSLLTQSELDAFEKKLAAETRVPIAVWVGGLDARAHGGAVRILAAADVIGVARPTDIGDSTPVPPGGKLSELVGKTMPWNEALKKKIATIDAPVLVEMVGRLDGLTLDGKRLVTIYSEKNAKGETIKKPYGVRFAKLGLISRLWHMATTPQVAYLFLLVALALFIFEFYTGGIGVAAVVGLMAFVIAVSGLGNLPTRPLGVALLGLSMLGFAIDIQAGTTRFWTAVGVVSLVIGSLTLFSDGVHVPLYWIAILTMMIVAFMVSGMPTMVRTRFATPTIGREAMIGEEGLAQNAINPEGVVVVRGAPWRARTNRATPIAAGEGIRVAAIDGFLLEVEPLEGAAKTHRG